MAFIDYSLSDINDCINHNDSYELNRYRLCQLIDINLSYILHQMKFYIVDTSDSTNAIDITPYITTHLFSGSGYCYDPEEDIIESLTVTFDLDTLQPDENVQFKSFYEYLSLDTSNELQLYDDESNKIPINISIPNNQLLIDWLSGTSNSFQQCVTISVDEYVVGYIGRNDLISRNYRDISVQFPVDLLNSGECLYERNKLIIDPIIKTSDDPIVKQILSDLRNRITGTFPDK